MIRDLTVTDEGRVTFTFLLAPEDPASLVRAARSAVAAVEGVRKDEIKINVTNPAGPAPLCGRRRGGQTPTSGCPTGPPRPPLARARRLKREPRPGAPHSLSRP